MDQILSTATSGLVWILAFALVLLGLKLAFQAKLIGMAGEAAVRKRLEKFTAAHDVIFPDSREKNGLTQIDHIVRLPNAIVCIETKNFSGLILGGPKQPKWTQCMGRQRYKFQNPLFQNYKHIQAVQKIVDSRCPVIGLVVFGDKAKFPKGMPDGVCTLDTLQRRLRELSDPLKSRTDKAWQAVLAASSKSSKMRKKHLHDLRAKHGPDLRLPVGLAFAGLGVLVGIAKMLFS